MSNTAQTECIIATTFAVVTTALFFLSMWLFSVGLPAAGASVLIGGVPGCLVASLQASERVASAEKSGRVLETTKNAAESPALLYYKSKFVTYCEYEKRRRVI